MTFSKKISQPNEINGLAVLISADECASKRGDAAKLSALCDLLRERLDRDPLPADAVGPGWACLLHVKNYQLGKEPSLVNRYTLKAIDAFAHALVTDAV